MKLIVDISDEAYELCKRGTTGTFLINSGMRSGKTFLMSLYKSITNGTPLTTESLNGDCISRAETQKHIYTRLYETALNNVGYKCEASDVFTNIAENRLNTWISEIPPIPSKPKIEWIPISERLPKPKEHLDDLVIVCRKGGRVGLNRYVSRKWLYGAQDVEYWMPFPKPYKAESEK